jgi:hypothetical protein
MSRCCCSQSWVGAPADLVVCANEGFVEQGPHVAAAESVEHRQPSLVASTSLRTQLGEVLAGDGEIGTGRPRPARRRRALGPATPRASAPWSDRPSSANDITASLTCSSDGVSGWVGGVHVHVCLMELPKCLLRWTPPPEAGTSSGRQQGLSWPISGHLHGPRSHDVGPHRNPTCSAFGLYVVRDSVSWAGDQSKPR